jgi:oligoribonuclease NrnB/cAMP/cGMP phosphodiesterase (DHH superfamily)
MDFDMEFLRRGGESINRKQLKDINELIEANAHRIVIAGHDVPGLNGPYMWASDACHIMAKGEPFAACYCDTGEGRVFQLRSADGGMNVAEIAKLFGGGGHEHAAGFSVPHHTGLIFIEPPIESTEILGETNVT